MLCAKLSVLLIFLTINKNYAARILGFFPVPSISHQVVFRQLTYELAKRGHTLVVITPDPAFNQDEASKNITEIDVHDLSYNLWRNIFVANVNGKTSPYKILEVAFELLSDIVEYQLQHKEVQEMINRNEKFDLILIEACTRAALVLSHIFKAPVIQVSSFGSIFPNLNVIGAPSNSILYPEMLSEKVHNMTLLEKIKNIWHDLRIRFLMQNLEGKINRMIARVIGNNAPIVSELEKNVEMLFINSYPLWDGNRPVPPGLVYIGGVHKRPSQEISEDMTQFLKLSTRGVIYMSFGTNVNTSLLPSTAVQVFLKVFSKLPYDVLLKWHTEEVIEKPKNVKLFKWLPQPEILKHPNIKLFITQGGLQSTEEAILAGVPMLAFPMLADQWYNAEKYVQFKIGLNLDITTITEEVFEHSISTVIKNQSYRESIKKLRSILLDQPMSGTERAVWWVEHVLRHGGARHLRTRLADVSWMEYLMLDVVAVLFSALFLSIVVLFNGIHLMRSTVESSHKKIKIKTH